MDVSQDLADYAAKHTSALLERPEPAQVDLGLLTAFDTTPTDPQLYSASLNAHLLRLTLASTTTLLSSLFALPTVSTPVGPVVRPPVPTTRLPREKPLPKPKPPTKWERFAKERGISHVRKERDEWDEEKQEWVRRWGKGGKNKEKEEQWIHEVKAKDDADHDPAATARAERKARIAKNTAQHESNVAHAKARDGAAAGPSTREQRKADLDRSMLISKTSTASLGKFDKKIEGEPKVKGVKRKFEANVTGEGWGEEKGKALDVLRKVESGDSKKKKGTQQEEGGVNHRKAVRHLAREERMSGRGGAGAGGRGGRGGRGGGRGRGRK